MPFVQGHLRGESLTCSIATECGHCGRPLHIEIDSRLSYRVLERDAEPLIYTPRVDLSRLKEPSIIDRF